MEQFLTLYALPYDPTYPVICFDEGPCFLIGDTLTPVPRQSGTVRKVQYTDEKRSSCALLAAIEPLTDGAWGRCLRNAPNASTRSSAKRWPPSILRRSKFG